MCSLIVIAELNGSHAQLSCSVHNVFNLSIAVRTHWKIFSFTNKEKVDMIFIFGIANRNVSEAQRMYGEWFIILLLPVNRS